MAYKKQLRDKDGNVVYPDVGIDLDDVVYSDDPTEPVETPSPWIKPNDISFSDFNTVWRSFSMPSVANTSVGSWTRKDLGSSVTVSGFDPDGSYMVVAMTTFAECAGASEFHLVVSGATDVDRSAYCQGVLQAIPYVVGPVKPASNGNLVFKRVFRGEPGNARCGEYYGVIIRIG